MPTNDKKYALILAKVFQQRDDFNEKVFNMTSVCLKWKEIKVQK